MSKVTLKEQIKHAIKRDNTKDKPQDIFFFVQPITNTNEWGIEQLGEAKGLFWDELPEDEYDPGYGGVEGPRAIGYSRDWVYILTIYDGLQWYTAIPNSVISFTKHNYKYAPALGGGYALGGG